MHEVVIIGSGPAGLTAAIYLSRANLAPVVIEGFVAGGTPPGGQLMTTTEVENYPGFPEGIQGPELMERMRAQASRFGTTYVSGDVLEVQRTAGNSFTLKVEDGDPLVAKAVILATGATAKYLGLHNEQRLIGRGVSGCATCDGAFFRDQEVAVVGGGDTAMEDSIYLTRMCKRVHVIHRRDKLRASKYMAERAMANEKIGFVWDSTVIDVLGDQAVTAVKLRNVKTGVESELKVDGLFLAIGHTPNAAAVKHLVDLDEKGYVKTEGVSTRTRTPGLFAAGDIMDSVYRQAVTAAGAGCKAALDVERYLETWKEG